MKKYRTGILSGVLAGSINCLFLLFAKDLSISVYVSSFITWIVIGLLISSVDFKLNGIAKGIIVAILVSLPSFIYTIESTIYGALWNLGITLLVSAIIGYIIEKVVKCTNEKRKKTI